MKHRPPQGREIAREGTDAENPRADDGIRFSCSMKAVQLLIDNAERAGLGTLAWDSSWTAASDCRSQQASSHLAARTTSPEHAVGNVDPKNRITERLGAPGHRQGSYHDCSRV